MYSREDKLRAVELFIKYDFSPQPSINELGYPCRASLYNRYKEYLANGNDISDANLCQRYGEGLKRVTVDRCFEHGKCLARTCRALGYPSKELLAAWIDEPIVQASPNAPNAYPFIDVMGQGAYGTPCIDSECSLETPFVMVYGNHMSDGSAFADFASFIDDHKSELALCPQ